MKHRTDDLRIREITQVLAPQDLHAAYPVSEIASQTVYETRRQIHDILHDADDRLLVVIGPCSVHDVSAAKDYAVRLKAVRDELADDLLVVMRVYFEKPRTTVGWKGLINDPNLDGTRWLPRGALPENRREAHSGTCRTSGHGNGNGQRRCAE